MPYSKALKKTIANSNFAHKYIINELAKRGIHIDKSYLSKIINGKLPAPREEISRAIAQICGVDERILIIEGYYDKAPKEIKDILFYIQKLAFISILSLSTDINNITNEQISLISEELKQQDIGEFLISLLDYAKDDNYSIVNGLLTMGSEKDDFKLQLEEPISFLIKTDDMFPIIPKNARVSVKIQNQYQNGDIIALNYKNEIIARYYFENSGIILFNPINKNATTLNSNDKDLKILGKISKVIYEVQ